MKNSTKVNVTVQGCSECDKKLSVKVSGKDKGEKRYCVISNKKEENTLIGGMNGYAAAVLVNIASAMAYVDSLDDDAIIITF